MRDILLTVIVLVLLVRTLRRPETGAYLWAWLSLMNPHRMSYGFALSVPWAYATAVVTLASMLFSKSRKPLPLNGGTVGLLVLWGWMTLTSAVSINPTDMVWERWTFVSKIYVMLLATLMVIRGRKQTDTLVWVVVASIAFFGFKGGIFTIATGGAYRVWGPPGSMVEENNSLAVALIIVLPLLYYLRHVATNRWLRHFLVLTMVLVGAAILGSQSRGALVGLLVMVFVLGTKTKYPVRFSMVLLTIVAIGIAFMPDTWSSRMDTIQNFGEDSSAMSRLYTWHTLWNVAVDRPLVGAGFRADTTALFARYAPTGQQYAIFQGASWVAHSIYFQALGEHGFVGLLLYLFLWVWVWVTSSRLSKQAEKLSEVDAWVPMLLRMCQVSTAGFCAGGAFLSLMNFDLPFYILAFVTLCQCAVKDRLLQAQAPAPTPAALRAAAGARLAFQHHELR